MNRLPQRRLSSPVDQDATYWEFASSDLMADIAEDLLGPNVKFHHSKLNFKWAEAGQEVKWHQDIQAWPHTDYSPLTMGIYLAGHDQGDGAAAVHSRQPRERTVRPFRQERQMGRDISATPISLVSPPLPRRCWRDRRAASPSTIAERYMLQSRTSRLAEGRCCSIHIPLGNRFRTRQIRFRARIRARLFGGSDRNGQITILAPAWCRRTGREGTARFSQQSKSAM